MLSFIFWVIALYFLYRLIFHFIIPVFRVSRQVKSQMREYQDRMHETESSSPFANPQDSTKNNSATTSEKAGEYIDFEEVK